MALSALSLLSTKFLPLLVMLIGEPSQEVPLSQRETAPILSSRDSARVVGRRQWSPTDRHLHGLRLIFWIRIEWMRARIENDEHIHLSSQLNRVTSFRVTRDEVHAAV